MRRLPCIAAAAIAVLCVPASASAQIVFDDGYDPNSPAGKQYSIPAEKVVAETSGGKVKRSGTKAQGAAAPLFGAGVTSAGSGSGKGRDDDQGGTAGGAGTGGGGSGSGGGQATKGHGSSASKGARGAGSAASGSAAGSGSSAAATQVLAERAAKAARTQAEGAASGTGPAVWLFVGIASLALIGFLLSFLGRLGRAQAPPPTTS